MAGSAKLLYVLWAVLLLLVFVAACLIVGGFTDACTLPVIMDATGAKPATWCWEFWLQRYQTLIQTVVAVIAVALAYVDYRSRQAREREQSEHIRDRERKEARRVAKLRHNRLIEIIVKLEHCWAMQIDVDENLVRLTREDIQRGHLDAMARFNGLTKLALDALDDAERLRETLKVLLMDVDDDELELHLRPYHGLLTMVVTEFRRRIRHAQQAVNLSSIYENQDWYLPDAMRTKQMLDSFRDKADARAAALTNPE